MRYCSWIAILLLVSGCSEQPSATVAPPGQVRKAGAERRPEIDEFLVDWFKSHGHEDVVVDADGVGIAGNATRLCARLYGSEPQKSGSCVVEVQFTIRLPSRHEINEFVAGIGDTEQKAVTDALVNFTLTTFHVVYKAFINADDPHMTIDLVPIQGTERQVLAGDLFMRGAAESNFDLNQLRPEIMHCLKGLRLTAAPHWLKIVYGQNNSQATVVSATLDNVDDPELTTAIAGLPWPKREQFYMIKQFIVIK